MHIQVSDPIFTEILEAELSELPFESFETKSDQLLAYIQTEKYDAPDLEALLANYSDHIAETRVEHIEHQNWNAVWESNYEPVKLGDELFIGASFHEDPKTTTYSILLNPNMSFGTGHHPTTALVLNQLFKMDLDGMHILDFGAGSGILSIYAALKGAHGVAIEIDQHAAQAAEQNLNLNSIDSFEIIAGDVRSIPKTNFDIILANINRNVIEESLDAFCLSLKNKGTLICSGILTSDIDPLAEIIRQKGFSIRFKSDLDNWGMISAEYVA